MKGKNAVENGIMSTKIKNFNEDDDKENIDGLDVEFTKSKKVEPEIPPISYFSLFRYATKSDKLLMALGVMCSMATGVCQPLNTYLFGKLVGDMIEKGGAMQNTTANNFISSITDFAVNNSLIGVGMLVFSYMSIALFNYAALRQIFYIRGKFFQCTLNQDISWYDVNQTGDFASRMSEDLIKLEEGIGEKVSMFVHYQIAFVSSLILAFIKGWELALICLISFPVTMIAVGLVGKVTSKLARQEMSAYGIAGAIAEEVFSSIRTVIAFGGQSKEIDRYKDKLVFARNINIKRSFFSGLGFGLLWFFIYGSYALAFWYGVGLVIDDKKKEDGDKIYDAGTMVTVFFSVMMGSMNFGISSPYFETFGIATGAGAKIYSVINSIPIINSFKNVGDKPDIKGKIIFKNVEFQYPSRPDVPILRNFSLSINPGQTVALVGSSGCGKSTCVQLMQRFYDPISGSISLDDRDIKDIDLVWLRANIGVVGQEPVLFGTSIAENIRYGNLSATQEDIEKAAKKSNAHDFVINLPSGYDTLVGERGAQLSGGQKQRIAIARALVRDPSILLLDEATSALDTNSEAKVQAALDHASKGCTTIIVAHRLSTIRNADKIVVVSNGQVVEEGGHDELMALKGAYYNLVTTQVTVDETVEGTTENAKEDVYENIAVKRTLSITSEKSESEDKNTPIKHSAKIGIAEEEKKMDVSLTSIIKVNSPEWFQITVGSVTSLIMGAAMPVFAIIFGDIIEILTNSDDDYVRNETNRYCIYFVIAGVVTGFATFLQIWNFGIAGERLTMRLRGRMFEAMLRQEIAWFDDRENGTGSLCSRLSTEAANVQGATGQRIGTILQSISTLSLGVGLSMYYEYRLGLVALAFTPVILIATFLQGRIIKQANEKHNNMIEKATKLAVEAISNVRTVASLGCEEKFYHVYISELTPGFVAGKRNVHYRGLVFGMARSLMFFAYAACMYYGGILIRDEHLSIGKVFKVSQSLIMGTVSIANALAFAPNFQKGLESAAKIFKLLDRQPLVPDALVSSNENWDQGNIVYSDVCFSYPSRPGIKVLRSLDLSIFRGQTVALVGPSGCGKSTVIQLLERFYDPNSGAITVDDVDIRNMKFAKLRAQMGIVSQEPSLFDRTIEENIAYGDNSRRVPKTEVLEAAKKANIHNFIASLPLGYDTRLGEKGTQLSGGQKQRVAIARALIRDPKILLLDEATSALDTESEKVVQDALDKAKQGRTCITIAHRLSTIQDADVICVINRGKVAEMGTHSQLLSQRGLYYRLHSLQGA